MGLDAFAAILYVLFFCGGALLTMRRPAYGVALLILIQPFALYGDVWHTNLTLPKATLLGVLLGLIPFTGALRVLSSRAPRAILIAGALLLVTTILTFAHATYTVPVTRETLKLVEYLLLFTAVVTAYRLDPDIKLIRAACIVVAAAVALIALSQEFVAAPSFLRINDHLMPRVAGPIEGPNQLAGYFDVALPLVLAFCITTPAPAAQFVLFLIVLADVLTFSRGGALGATLGTLVVALTFRKNIARPLSFMAAGLLLGIGVAGIRSHSLGFFRLWNFSDTSYAGGVGSRSKLWHAASTLWERHPIFGIGAGNFELEIPLAGVRGIRTHANSLYLQQLVEGGIPSILATLWLT
ncbi:MAG TPA: O-antigen ligase family protein, partial [Candidatus Rubrimentiphilum sp.]|nr:O-antigen ligase family protein [Candidatus Rubrimentiphilum sp.]